MNTKRHALSDEQWAVVEPLLPKPKKRKTGKGRWPKDKRLMLDGIFWILSTGAPWRDLPERFGPWQTVYDHFSKWRKAGVFAAILEALQIKLDDQGLIDWELWCVDGACVRASRAAAVKRRLFRRPGELSSPLPSGKDVQARRDVPDGMPDHVKRGHERAGLPVP